MEEYGINNRLFVPHRRRRQTKKKVAAPYIPYPWLYISLNSIIQASIFPQSKEKEESSESGDSKENTAIPQSKEREESSESGEGEDNFATTFSSGTDIHDSINTLMPPLSKQSASSTLAWENKIWCVQDMTEIYDRDVEPIEGV